MLMYQWIVYTVLFAAARAGKDSREGRWGMEPRWVRHSYQDGRRWVQGGWDMLVMGGAWVQRRAGIVSLKR